jgi:hypothetical protein
MENIKKRLFGGEEQEEGWQKERVIGDKYDQSTLYACMKRS